MKRLLFLLLLPSFVIAQNEELPEHLLPLNSLIKDSYNGTWSLRLESEKDVEPKNQTVFSVSKASEINVQTITTYPNVQGLRIAELDSLPDIVKEWKDLQVLDIVKVNNDAYIPAGFSSFYPYLRCLDIRFDAPKTDSIFTAILDGNYVYMEQLSVYLKFPTDIFDDPMTRYMSSKRKEALYKEAETTIPYWTLPEQVCNWTKLRTLHTSRLENFTISFACWTSLERLVLSKYKGNLEGINQCTLLEGVILSMPENKNADVLNTLVGLENLEELSLKNIPSVNYLPESCFELPYLRSLYLSGMGLKALPENMGDMYELEDIVLNDLKINRLPESITRLSNVFSLTINECPNLETLPPKIGNMKGLRMLHLSNNGLETLPKSITTLDDLYLIDVSYNRLQQLPKGKYKWDPDEILLEGNQLETLPKGFVKMLSKMKAEDYPYLAFGVNWFSSKVIREVDEKVDCSILWEVSEYGDHF